MTILLTGGTGKTATRLAIRLNAANIPFLLASRRGPDAAPKHYPAVKFDWTDETTWKNPFDNESIRAIYMMEPQVPQPWVPMIKFIDFAKERGVKRYVLCAGTTAEIGKDGMGRVWEHYIQSNLDFCVLRPPWFMGRCASKPQSLSSNMIIPDNLAQPGLVYTISQLNQISTACQNGRIPFISIDDIADVAFHALTNEKSYNRDFRILGPELLTYDDVQISQFVMLHTAKLFLDCRKAFHGTWTKNRAYQS